MLTIRLQRVGRKNDPSFRVVVVESKRKPQTGNYLEMVGSYDARFDKTALKADRIKHWIGMGATLSDTVHNILINEKVIEGKKINVLPKKSPPKKEGENTAAADTDKGSSTEAGSTLAATATAEQDSSKDDASGHESASEGASGDSSAADASVGGDSASA